MSKKTLNQSEPNSYDELISFVSFFGFWIVILIGACLLFGVLIYCQTTTAMGHEYSLI